MGLVFETTRPRYSRIGVDYFELGGEVGKMNWISLTSLSLFRLTSQFNEDVPTTRPTYL